MGNIPALEEEQMRQLASRGDEATQKILAEALPTQTLLITLFERTAYLEKTVGTMLHNMDCVARHYAEMIGEEYNGIPQSIRDSLFDSSGQTN